MSQNIHRTAKNGFKLPFQMPTKCHFKWVYMLSMVCIESEKHGKIFATKKFFFQKFLSSPPPGCLGWISWLSEPGDRCQRGWSMRFKVKGPIMTFYRNFDPFIVVTYRWSGYFFDHLYLENVLAKKKKFEKFSSILP